MILPRKIEDQSLILVRNVNQKSFSSILIRLISVKNQESIILFFINRIKNYLEYYRQIEVIQNYTKLCNSDIKG